MIVCSLHPQRRPFPTRPAFAALVFLSLTAGLARAQAKPEVAQTKALPTPAQPVADFIDITDKTGIHFNHVAGHTTKKYLIETMGSGVAVFDFDNDGLLDIFVANGTPIADPTSPGTLPQKSSPADWNRLYHQTRNGAFEDVTEKAGLAGAGYSLGVAVGDYDNDGYEDLYVTSYGGNHLYHNNGNGTFTDVTASSATGGSGWSTSAAWVDLDGDGLLDLVVLRYVKWDWDNIWCGEHREGYRSYCHPDVFPAIAPLVFHNEGNGRFTEQSKARGISVPGKGLGIALGDYDRDGKVDIVVANDSTLEHVYRNKGDGTFEETGLGAEIAVDGDGRTYAGMGIAFADYNNDGLPDLLITNLANQKYALYQNNGDGTFSYGSYTSGIGGMTLLHSGWGTAFMDFDNDGRKDLLVVQGHDLDTIELVYPQIHYREKMLLAHNTGRGFADVSAAAGPAFQAQWVGRGLAIGDLFNDGHISAVVTENNGPLHVVRNRTENANHWLGLLLVGHRSNRDAIGAEVKITTPDGASQWATVSTAGSYLSSSDKRLHFGLGANGTVRSVEVLWPSGIHQRLNDVRADQILTLDEPKQDAGPAAVTTAAQPPEREAAAR
ncbi:MAG: CRTAC1 family protein [Acidobacteriota bacterium]|nr:CRTAC1 family protein [Acidobacteriota bacterium]